MVTRTRGRGRDCLVIVTGNSCSIPSVAASTSPRDIVVGLTGGAITVFDLYVTVFVVTVVVVSLVASGAVMKPVRGVAHNTSRVTGNGLSCRVSCGSAGRLNHLTRDFGRVQVGIGSSVRRGGGSSRRRGRVVTKVTRSLQAPLASVGKCLRKVESKITGAPRGRTECFGAVCSSTGSVRGVLGSLLAVSGLRLNAVALRPRGIHVGSFLRCTGRLNHSLRRTSFSFRVVGDYGDGPLLDVSASEFTEIVSGVVSGDVGCGHRNIGNGVALDVSRCRRDIVFRVTSGNVNISGRDLNEVFSALCETSGTHDGIDGNDKLKLTIYHRVIRRRNKLV